MMINISAVGHHYQDQQLGQRRFCTPIWYFPKRSSSPLFTNNPAYIVSVDSDRGLARCTVPGRRHDKAANRLR
jgi:hypothetical protein